MSYLVPAPETGGEIVVVNSRFIATAAPAGTVEEAVLAENLIRPIGTLFAVVNGSGICAVGRGMD